MDKFPSNINVGRTGRLGGIVDSQTPKRKVVLQVAGAGAVLVLVLLYPMISNTYFLNLYAILIGIAVGTIIRPLQLLRVPLKATTILVVVGSGAFHSCCHQYGEYSPIFVFAK
jgi:hypothetical protein